MSEARIARVYADGLFRAAEEVDRVQPVGRDLHSFVEAYHGSRELRDMFSNQDIPGETRKLLVLELTEGGDPLVRNLLRLLIDKGREDILEDLDKAFADMVEVASNVVTVVLTTARPIPQSLKAEVKASLESSLQKIVELEHAVDESIIGGVKLRIGDRIADASIRHRLDQLRVRLTSPAARLEGSVEAAS